MTKTIDFNDLSGGTIVDNEYQSAGVTIQAWTAGGVGNRAMIFDTSNPTGGDYDLATSNLGNALIVSEDGDSHDPDDARRIADQVVLVADGRVHPPQGTADLLDNPPPALRAYLG